MGTEGAIRIAPPWWKPEHLRLEQGGDPLQTFDLPSRATVIITRRLSVGRCLRVGALESPVMLLDETLSIMRTMDAIRAQWGLVV
ncbi:MAG: hypothetical protein U0521_02275 [Anaerolineae bacterium]